MLYARASPDELMPLPQWVIPKPKSIDPTGSVCTRMSADYEMSPRCQEKYENRTHFFVGSVFAVASIKTAKEASRCKFLFL